MKGIVLIISFAFSLYSIGQNPATKKITCSAKIAGFYEAELQTKTKNVNAKKDAYLNISFGYGYQKLTGIRITVMDTDSLKIKAKVILSVNIYLCNNELINLSQKEFSVPYCYSYN